MSYDVVNIPGDGIGPEIADATRRAVDATGVSINWHHFEAGGAQIDQHGTPLPPGTVDAAPRPATGSPFRKGCWCRQAKAMTGWWSRGGGLGRWWSRSGWRSRRSTPTRS